MVAVLMYLIYIYIHTYIGAVVGSKYFLHLSKFYIVSASVSIQFLTILTYIGSPH